MCSSWKVMAAKSAKGRVLADATRVSSRRPAMCWISAANTAAACGAYPEGQCGRSRSFEPDGGHRRPTKQTVDPPGQGQSGDCRRRFPDATFDKALCVHVVYFWPDLIMRSLVEIASALRPGGRLALLFWTKADQAVDALPTDVSASHMWRATPCSPVTRCSCLTTAQRAAISPAAMPASFIVRSSVS